MNYRLRSRLDRTSPLIQQHIDWMRRCYGTMPVIGIGKIDSALLQSKGTRREKLEGRYHLSLLSEEYIVFYLDNVTNRALWVARGEEVYKALWKYPKALQGLQVIMLRSRFHTANSEKLKVHWSKIYIGLPKTGNQGPDWLVRELIEVDKLLRDAFPEEAPRMSQRQGSGAPSSS